MNYHTPWTVNGNYELVDAKGRVIGRGAGIPPAYMAHIARCVNLCAEAAEATRRSVPERAPEDVHAIVDRVLMKYGLPPRYRDTAESPEGGAR